MCVCRGWRVGGGGGGVYFCTLFSLLKLFFPDPSMTTCGFPISGRIISVSGYYRGVWAASHTY